MALTLIDTEKLKTIGTARVRKPSLFTLFFTPNKYVFDIISENEKNLGSYTLYLDKDGFDPLSGEIQSNKCQVKIDSSLAKHMGIKPGIFSAIMEDPAKEEEENGRSNTL